MLNTLVYKKDTNMFNVSPIDYLLVNWNIFNPDVYITNIKNDDINNYITFDVYIDREVLCFKLLLLSPQKKRTFFELSCLNQEINDNIANLIVKYNAEFVTADYDEMNEFIKLKNITNYSSSSNLLINFLNSFNDEFEAFEQSDSESDSDTKLHVFKDINETTININMNDIPKSIVASQLEDTNEQYNIISVKEEVIDDVEDIWGDDDDFKKSVNTDDIFFLDQTKIITSSTEYLDKNKN